MNARQAYALCMKSKESYVTFYLEGILRSASWKGKSTVIQRHSASTRSQFEDDVALLKGLGYVCEIKKGCDRELATVSWDFSEEERFKLDGPEYQAAVKEMVDS